MRIKFIYRVFIRVSLIIIFTAALSSCAPQESKHPNIILILADDLGYNDLSVYRSSNQPQSATKPPTSMTPNIDLIAEQGMRFTDFYCGAAVCSPSRSALLTGRNATRVGIYNWIPEHSPMHLRSSEITIAEILKTKSYKTGHFGKWHLTSFGTEQPLPADQGYDYSFYTYNNADPSHNDPLFFFRYFHDPIFMIRKGDWCLLGYDELIPPAEYLDEVKLDKIKPWHFTKDHMDYLTNVSANHFELYNLRLDKEQENDLASKYPDLVNELKTDILRLHNEMINEGGNWYP